MNMQERPAASASDAVNCVPVPGWVEHEPYRSQVPEGVDVTHGVCQLLSDVQIDLTGPDLAWHYRCAQRVVTRAGAEKIAQLRIEFDPSFQKLDVHSVRVVRGEQCTDHAKPDAFQILQRETNLERLVLDGRLTASLLVPDVRVDDIVETSFTLYGSNSALGGKYSGWIGFDPFNPWIEARYRLRRPLNRGIAIRRFNEPPECTTAVKDGVDDTRWRLEGQKRRLPEALTPPWVIQAPALQLSEFASWNEVATLFAPFYGTKVIPEALAAEIDRLAAACASPADRAVEWLRFVQRELRYFALSLGEGGLLPRQAQAIWSSRFGDCKDASLLYAAGARRLGLDACAALVSTTHGFALNDFLPSANVFNHCIVRVRLNGVSYWLDPTMKTQSGNLENIYQAHAGWALPLTPETTGLETLKDADPLLVLNCEEELRFGPKRKSPATLRRRVEHRSWAADAIRNGIADAGLAAYATHRLKESQIAWNDVVEIQPVEISDDQINNRLTEVFNYEIRDVWKQEKSDGRFGVHVLDRVVSVELGPLQGAERRTDIYLGRPRKVRSRLLMHMPSNWTGSGWDHAHHAQAVNYTTELTFGQRTIESVKELTIGAWSMPAAQADAYSRVVGRLRENILIVSAREWLGKLRPMAAMSWRKILQLVWIIFVVFIGLQMCQIRFSP
jgi:transglutaminase-like putative cysteine protease